MNHTACVDRLRLVCLAGPTGAGKSALALALARHYNGVIVNADSRQVYRDFPIITAQPSAAEQALCEHRLYGWLDTGTRLSAGRWAKLAAQEIRAILADGRLPIVVGGTGLYMRALFDGIAEIPSVPQAVREHWQAALATQGAAALHRHLEDIDPICATRIHPNDRQRITRALEVHEATGQPLSWWQAQTPEGPAWDVLRAAPKQSLDELSPQLSSRIDAMLDAGAVDEARAALSRCPDATAPGWSGIGCTELHAYLQGTLDEAALRRQWLSNTRAYAKRQLTWFRADQRYLWYTDPAQIIAWVKEWLVAPYCNSTDITTF